MDLSVAAADRRGQLAAARDTDARLFADMLDRSGQLGNAGAAAWGAAFPRAANVFPGDGGVKPNIAIEILRNISEGKPPFKPELGEHGPVSWFVTKGNPYVGSNAASNVTVPVELKNTTGKPLLDFGENELTTIYDSKYPAALQKAELQWREKNQKPTEPLSSKARNLIARNANAMAEREMWTEVGRRVAASESGMGRVVLENSRFSHSGNGEFTLTARADAVSVKGGAQTVLDLLKAQGAKPEPGLLEAAEKVASREKWVGRVQGVLRYGGRVLIIVGAVADGYRIYSAQDRTRETVRVAGGWGGAIAAGSMFSAWYAPADAAGPWAWVGHGVGALVAGGVGYFAASDVAERVYDLVVDEHPLAILPAAR
jgi:hypothetical protein